MSPPWKQWKANVWFGAKESDADEPVQATTVEVQKKARKEKPTKKVEKDVEEDFDEAVNTIGK